MLVSSLGVILAAAASFFAHDPVALATWLPHPHVPKALQVKLGRGHATLLYFTVPYSDVEAATLAKGSNWHLGFATFFSEVPLRVVPNDGDGFGTFAVSHGSHDHDHDDEPSETEAKPDAPDAPEAQAGVALNSGSYKFDVHLNLAGEFDGFVLTPMRLWQLKRRLTSATRRGQDDRVTELTKDLADLEAQMKENGEAQEVKLPAERFESKKREHLGFAVLNHGYTTKERLSEVPAGGARFELLGQFGPHHISCTFEEVVGIPMNLESAPESKPSEAGSGR